MSTIRTIQAYRPTTDVYNNFQSEKDIRHYPKINHRYHTTEKNTTTSKVVTGAASVIGTLLPMMYFAKKQNRGIFNLNIGIKEMIGISSGSILGGLAGGILTSEKRQHKQKVHEGVFQYLNATIPPILVFAGFKILENCKKASSLNKILVTVAGLGLGMPLAADVANKINDPHDKVPDRKLTFKDSLANIDDAIGALALAKIPGADKIPFNKIVPPVYALCGYRTGQSN